MKQVNEGLEEVDSLSESGSSFADAIWQPWGSYKQRDSHPKLEAVLQADTRQVHETSRPSAARDTTTPSLSHLPPFIHLPKLSAKTWLVLNLSGLTTELRR